jgi:hypothetical protein
LGTIKCGEFLYRWETVSSWRRIRFMEFNSEIKTKESFHRGSARYVRKKYKNYAGDTCRYLHSICPYPETTEVVEKIAHCNIYTKTSFKYV